MVLGAGEVRTSEFVRVEVMLAGSVRLAGVVLEAVALDEVPSVSARVPDWLAVVRSAVPEPGAERWNCDS